MPDRLINLTFHGVGRTQRPLDDGENAVWISRERFVSVLDSVAGRDDVRITFDDGNASDLAIALPALQARGLTATFFVVAARLGVDGFLAPQDLATLVQAGMTVGSHGMHHRPWRGLDPGALREELVEARGTLEAAAGHEVGEAACPFGAYGRRSLRALREAGYARVYTSDRGATAASAWLQPRTTITEDAALEPILAPDAPSYARRAKLVVKRWR